MKSKRQTAGELLGELTRDHEYVRRRREHERWFGTIRAEVEKFERPLLVRLRQMGVQITSVWDLADTPDQGLAKSVVNILRATLAETLTAQEGVPLRRFQEQIVRVFKLCT